MKIGLAVILLISSSAFAKNLFVDLPPVSVKDIDLQARRHFLQPNELQPSNSASIFEAAPKGVLIAVGTERVYFDFIQATQATHVLAVDNDKKVVKFHNINGLLMRMTPPGNREIYHDLRFVDTIEDWKRQARWAVAQGRITADESAKIESEQLYTWWKVNISAESEKRWDTPPKWLDNGGDGIHLYKSDQVNYLTNDRAFRKVQVAFEKGRFVAYNIELGDVGSLKNLVAKLKDAKLTLSALDLSNAADSQYLGEEATRHLLQAFQPIAKPESLIVATDLHKMSNRSQMLTDYSATLYQAFDRKPTEAAKFISDFSNGYFDHHRTRASFVLFESYGKRCDDELQIPQNWDIQIKNVSPSFHGMG